MNLQQEFQQQSVIMKILKTHHEQKRSYNLINLNNGDNQKIIILEQATKKVNKNIKNLLQKTPQKLYKDWLNALNVTDVDNSVDVEKLMSG